MAAEGDGGHLLEGVAPMQCPSIRTGLRAGLLSAALVACSDPPDRSVAGDPALRDDRLAPDTVRIVQHESLWNVRRAALSEDRLYLLNSGSNEILVFGPGGEFEAVIGGPGQGPGEFGFARDLVVRAPDSVYVLDSLLRRVSRFVGGTLDAEWSLREAPARGYPERLAVLDGRFVLAFRSGVPETETGPDPNTRRELVRFVAMRQEGEDPWEFLFSAPGVEQMTLHVAAGRLETIPAFATDLRYELTEGGVIGTERIPGWVKRWDWDGDEMVLREAPSPPRYLSDHELRAWREGVEERVRRGSSSGEDPHTHRLSLMAGVERWADGVPRPVFDDLVASETLIGLGEYEFRGGPVPAWSFLDGEGAFLGRWSPEQDVRVLAIQEDRIVSVVRDSLDVESILIFRIPGE